MKRERAPKSVLAAGIGLIGGIHQIHGRSPIALRAAPPWAYPGSMDSITNPKPSILDLTTGDLRAALTAAGQPGFRAEQIERWIYRDRVFDFRAMTNLPVSLRNWLSEQYSVLPLAPVAEQRSSDGWTRKQLFQIASPARASRMNPVRQTVESVLMRYDPTDSQRGRQTVCVSSQAGCAVGCPFCATGQAGFVRNLSAGEIVAQVLYFSAQNHDDPVSNVVLMGQGEPMLNLDAVWLAVERIHDPIGLNIGARHITISTVGIIPGILAITQRTPPIRLAVSLHAPNDGLRDELVPINRKYPLAELIAACRMYVEATGRRITFEYALMGGVNDDLVLARQLVKLIRGLPSHVNLIPLNPTPGGAFVRPLPEQVDAFRDVLIGGNIPTTVRVERGIDIFAGCGQLRANEAKRLVPA